MTVRQRAAWVEVQGPVAHRADASTQRDGTQDDFARLDAEAWNYTLCGQNELIQRVAASQQQILTSQSGPGPRRSQQRRKWRIGRTETQRAAVAALWQVMAMQSQVVVAEYPAHIVFCIVEFELTE